MLRNLVWIVPLSPLLSFAALGLFGRRTLRDKSHLLACPAVGLSFIVSLAIFIELLLAPPTERVLEVNLFRWIYVGDLTVNVAFRLDQLSAIMILVVSGVGFFIHVYSIGYMHGDPRYYRFFCYLNLFTFSMLLLVLANNFLLMFVGWELVGLCSYLLISFWFERPSAATAGRKAFVVNRVGDAAFVIALLTIFALFGTFDFEKIFGMIRENATLSGWFAEVGARRAVPLQAVSLLTAPMGVKGVSLATLITLALFFGATGKSAQVPLYVWLPDAMEGPTPVSALIHAATMVTAGVYMVVRCNALFLLSPVSMTVVATVGAITAIYSASIAMTQFDIKRVLAYSTISQLGYMFLAAGAGAFAASIFHLMTHAFFKALLFLGAGSVIHALSGTMDMRQMGGLRRHLPITFWTMATATCAIAGVPGTAGFFSKDTILFQTLESHVLSRGVALALWSIGGVTVFMTTLYMFRLLLMTFAGECRVPQEEQVGAQRAVPLHESPAVMTVPLVVLAVMSVVGGYLNIPATLGGHAWFEGFLAPVMSVQGDTPLHEATTTEWMNTTICSVLVLVAFLLAYLLYVKKSELAEEIRDSFGRVYRLVHNKYYVDELYGATIVRLTSGLSTFSNLSDMHGVDEIVNDTARFFQWCGGLYRRIQNGNVQRYGYAMGLGLAVGLVLYLMW